MVYQQENRQPVVSRSNYTNAEDVECSDFEHLKSEYAVFWTLLGAGDKIEINGSLHAGCSMQRPRLTDLLKREISASYLNHSPIVLFQLHTLHHAMAPTSAFHSLSQQDVLDTIHAQFTLSEDTLLNLTKTFLREAAQGLANYGHSMAMMCVLDHRCQSILY